MNAPSPAPAPARDEAPARTGRESAPPDAAKAGPGAPEKPAEPEREEREAEGDDGGEPAWDSRRDLYRHSPGIMFRHAVRLGGSLVGGDQHGVSGGQVLGDVVVGSKNEYHFSGLDGETSGDIPVRDVETLAAHFVRPVSPRAEEPDGSPVAPESANDARRPDGPFDQALEQLRRRRVVIISGAATTGRGTGALMLLRAAGSARYRELDPTLRPGRQVGDLREHSGHVLVDYTTSAEQPLREHHIRALSEKLRSLDSHLVIVVGPHPMVQGVDVVPWRPPESEQVIRGHLGDMNLDGHAIEELLALPEVRTVLGNRLPVSELVRFARRIAEYARGECTRAEVARFGLSAAERQVRQWFDDSEQTLHAKAFLVALAAFDEAPYPVTVELGDVLFVLLQQIEDPQRPARIPVFGTSSAQRVELAQADRYEEPEETEWGPVRQTKIQFRDRYTAITLLHEVWTGHPSARPALVAWLRKLATDARPLVRNRAAATTAILARADLPSTMALLIQRWAADRLFRPRLAAANTLTLAHHLGTPHVPRILREWCTAPDEHLRWTAVRTYGLVGETFPADAITALIEAVRAAEAEGRDTIDEWSEEIDEIAQSAATLLLAAGRNVGASDGERHTEDGRGTEETDDDGPGSVFALWPLLVSLARGGATRKFVLRTVIHACAPTDDTPDAARPLLLDLFMRSRSTPQKPGTLLRQSLADLWRMVLNDPTSTEDAVAAMRGWIRAAEQDPEAEHALAELLPMLIVSTEDARRLVYLLENPRGGEGAQSPSAVARRLRVGLSAPDAATLRHPMR
ncbi:HEAT repeat domain-containing protein [Embleya sp. NPDC059237]|uniref:HEAT repeat domain-containing protein n=1 Tax=Embleya sp. NPDC059237 TaxID=3346784 RepID=UPI0036B6C6CB